jgi:hypothetical protein
VFCGIRPFCPTRLDCEMLLLMFYDWVCRMVISFGGCRSAISVGTRSSIFGFLMRYGLSDAIVSSLCLNVIFYDI